MINYPLQHSMKFEADFGKNRVFLIFFEESYCYSYYSDEGESAKQALSSVIDVLNH